MVSAASARAVAAGVVRWIAVFTRPATSNYVNKRKHKIAQVADSKMFSNFLSRLLSRDFSPKASSAGSVFLLHGGPPIAKYLPLLASPDQTSS